MTSSDDDLAWRLKRELHAEAARLMPAQDGLSQIRAQLGSRHSSPLWGGLRVDAERYGLHLRHLAAEAADWVVVQTRRIPFPGRSRGAHDAERPAGAHHGMLWLRPVLAVAAVCIFAGTAAAVPGLRHAITNIGSSGSGSTTSITGHGGGSGAGTGQKIPGGNSPAGGRTGTTATATPSPSSTCANAAKPVPSVKATPTQSKGTAVSPTTSPAQSTPAATPTTAPASPTESPTTPTGSSDPTPTGTSGAPSGTSSTGPTDSSHLTKVKPCPGPTVPGSASAAAASASQLPTAIPAPVQTSAQVYEPVTTPTTSAAASSSTSSAAADSSATTPTASSTASSGSPWSQGFATARACRHHPHPGC